ncbi:MAG: HAD family phosphatase [Bacteroidota bacterium]
MIKNIIFDFGNVLYEIAPERTMAEFAKLSAKPELIKNYSVRKFGSTEIFLHFEKGKISSAKFRDFIRKELFISASDEELDKAWNLTLIGLFPDSVPIINEFKNKFCIALLSNTNEIHYNFFEHQCIELFAAFQQCFFSHKLGMRKPDENIYINLLNKLKYQPSETLFVDDTIDNIETAAELGIHTYLVSEDNPLSELIHIVE